MLAETCVVSASLLAGGFMGAWLFHLPPAPVAGIEVDAALQAQTPNQQRPLRLKRTSNGETR